VALQYRGDRGCDHGVPPPFRFHGRIRVREAPLPGKERDVWLVVSTLTVPAQVTLIPVFFILRFLGLLDTIPA